MGLDGKNLKELASSTYGPIGSPAWSPDGKLIALFQDRRLAVRDIYLIPSYGGEEKKITFDSANEANPRFSADGTKVYFLRREGDEGVAKGGRRHRFSACRWRSSPATRTRPEQSAADGSAEPGPERRTAAQDGGRAVTAQDAEHRLGRPQAAHASGHAAGVGLQLTSPRNDGRTLIFVGFGRRRRRPWRPRRTRRRCGGGTPSIYYHPG